MMIVTKTLTVAAGIVASYLAVTAMLAPPPIEVHSLRYDGGFIYQDRTVTVRDESGPKDDETDDEVDVVVVPSAARFFAFWNAQLIYADTGGVVEHCKGGGSWPYKAGRIVARIPLHEWVGSDDCTPDSLDPSRVYIPVAAWSWGDDGTSHEGEPFSID